MGTLAKHILTQGLRILIWKAERIISNSEVCVRIIGDNDSHGLRVLYLEERGESGPTVVTGPRAEAMSQRVPRTFYNPLRKDRMPSHSALLRVLSPPPCPPLRPVLTSISSGEGDFLGKV